jgi:hypothetical protein
MSQLIACATVDGIVIASDSKAEFFDASGEQTFLTVDRLFTVGSHAVLAAAGGLEAASLARDFAAFVKDEKLTGIDAIIQAATPYFTGKVDDFFRKACEKLPLDPVINLYLVLAGVSPQTPDNPNRLFVIWDRVKPPKIESSTVTHIFTLPRRLGVEYKLNAMVARLAPLAEVTAYVKSAMEKLASQDAFIGPPHRYLTVTKDGVFTA